MLKILSKALRDVKTPHSGDTQQENLRVAMAALLVHASKADGNFDESERRKILNLLQNRFNLTNSECDQLIEKGVHEDQIAVDLYSFTKTLASELDQNGRQEFVKMMWGVILVDGEIDDFESHLIWRVSDLLGVSTRDRVHLRQEVEGN